jgi:hypothetical protein
MKKSEKLMRLLSQQNGFGPIFLHSLLHIGKKAQQSLTLAREECI